MTRLLLFLLAVAVFAGAAAWLAEHPGTVTVRWQGWEAETSVAVMLLALAALLAAGLAAWSLLRAVLGAPGRLARHIRGRRRDRGRRALSRGMIAVGAGDSRGARRAAREARRFVPDEPLSLLLEAQAAQMSGDRTTARRAFEAMLASPSTELLGLRGLYLEAQRADDARAARAHAARAAAAAPGLAWAGNALLEFHTAAGDWEGALEANARNAANGIIGRDKAARQRAVLLVAQALHVEEHEPDAALAHALEAHKLAPELTPAAVVAGRLLASASDTRQATRILERAWRHMPHPDVAEVYAHARPGDTARDRLKRARALAARAPGSMEGAVAVAIAAIDAREWAAARDALAPFAAGAPTRRVCQFMAEIEEGESGDAGRVREWLARALRAPRDAAWVADGYVSRNWAPVSPVSGRLDAFEWMVPPMALADESPREHVVEAVHPAPAPTAIEVRPAPEPVPAPPAATPAGDTALAQDGDGRPAPGPEPLPVDEVPPPPDVPAPEPEGDETARRY